MGWEESFDDARRDAENKIRCQAAEIKGLDAANMDLLDQSGRLQQEINRLREVNAKLVDRQQRDTLSLAGALDVPAGDWESLMAVVRRLRNTKEPAANFSETRWDVRNAIYHAAFDREVTPEQVHYLADRLAKAKE